MKPIFFLLGMVGTIFASQGFTQGLEAVRYVAVGDSYTIGTGASLVESWPAVLTRHLQSAGIQIDLVANLAIAGKTAQNVLQEQLPVFQRLHPSFATLLIGANDCVQGVDINIFAQRLTIVMDRLLSILPGRDRLVILTIPDFSITPRGLVWSADQNLAGKIRAYNRVIVQAAAARGLAVIDLYDVSRGMKDDSSLVSRDGLHPSAKEYAVWEKLIYPKVFQILQKNF